MNSYWKIPQELLVQNNVRHCKNIYEYGMLFDLIQVLDRDI